LGRGGVGMAGRGEGCGSGGGVNSREWGGWVRGGGEGVSRDGRVVLS